jgi:hypothetical protein
MGLSIPGLFQQLFKNFIRFKQADFLKYEELWLVKCFSYQQ